MEEAEANRYDKLEKFNPKSQMPGSGPKRRKRQASAQAIPEKENESRRTPVLDNFGRDLTRLAEENKLDPVIGREKELERIAQILSRRKKITQC